MAVFLLFSFASLVVKFQDLAGLRFILKAFCVFYQFLLYSSKKKGNKLPKIIYVLKFQLNSKQALSL